jgi:cytochrome c oxidase subunit 2
MPRFYRIRTVLFRKYVFSLDHKVIGLQYARTRLGARCFPSSTTSWFDAFPVEQQATVVRVVAEQFIWNVQYQGPDGLFGRTRFDLVGPDNPLGLDISDPAARDDVWMQNQLNLPVGRPVIVHLSSKDVIHSFGLPQMRVKQDAIPGIEQRLWFTPTRTGEWEITCSQLCGLGHYRMRGFYAIQTQADFNAWLASQPAGL